MRASLFLRWGLIGAIALTLTVVSCKKDDPAGPMVTLSQTDFNGNTGQTASTTATVVAEGGFKSLKITKFIGTTVDMSYGTGGTLEVTNSTFTLEYTLNEEGVTEPIRFNFTAEDNNGKTGSADFIVTTNLTLRYLLLNFNWRWHSKVGKVFAADPEAEQILPCEQDNVYTFNPDGTMSIDYGPITGTGGGTCDFDGLRVEERWELNESTNTLTLFLVNAFDPNDVDAQQYRVTNFSLQAIRSEQTIDLTIFGGVVWDWKFEWRAVPK